MNLMKNCLRNIILSTGIAIILACSERPKIYEEIKTCEAYLIKTGNGYFLKGAEFDFITDEEHAKKINENSSAVVKYKIVYEVVRNGAIDEYGKKKDLLIVKENKLIDVWPKEEKR